MRRFPILLAVLVLAGCGGSKDDESSDETAATATPTATETEAPPGKVKISGAPNMKPVVKVTPGTPPGSLVIKDIVRGKGAKAKSGDTVTVDYVGVSYSDGQQFDASWDHGQPFSFSLGQGMVIPGWDKGLVGMKTGGRRELIIPPDLGYGAAGQGPIKPNETLVFVVDLHKVK